MSDAEPKDKSRTKTLVPRGRLEVFGPPLLLLGEDAAAYDDLFAGIHAAVKPVDTLDEMLVADVVALEWEVLRWRRLKSALLRVRLSETLEKFLAEQLDYDLYAENFADALASTLKDNLPRDQAHTAEELARAYARNDPDAEDKVKEIFENASTFLDMNKILATAQRRKAKELAQKYARREADAVVLLDEILAGASVNIDDLMAEELAYKIHDIERIDRLTTIAEGRRNASLREIDRRRAVLGERLRRSFREVENAEFQVVETTPANGKNAA
jgi:hypothetical protein